MSYFDGRILVCFLLDLPPSCIVLIDAVLFLKLTEGVNSGRSDARDSVEIVEYALERDLH